MIFDNDGQENTNENTSRKTKEHDAELSQQVKHLLNSVS